MNYMCVPGIKKKYREESAPVITPEKIIVTVCNHFMLPISQVKSKSREQELVYARHIIFFLLRKYASLTLKSAGALLNRDHTTVIHSVETLNNLMDTESNVRDEVELLEATIRERI